MNKPLTALNITFRPLPAILKKNSFGYVLCRRGSHTMIYEQRDEGKTVGYEVFKIIIDPPKDILGKTIPARERFPKDSDFGISAWACSTLEKALERFAKLEK